jgi:transposase
MCQPILGIDVSKESLDVCLILGNLSRSSVFENNSPGHKQLISWLEKNCGYEQVHACMEATGMYAFPLAEALYTAGLRVSVVNPARICAYAKSLLARNKTDRLDATIIADFCRTQSPPTWHPPREELLNLQSLVRLLADLNATRQAELNRLKSGVRSADVVLVLEDLICFLNDQIKDVEQLFRSLFIQNDDLARKKQLLLSIPGIGEKTAHTILGEILYLDSFEDARQVAAYAGLNPKQRLSGKMKGHCSISKTGNAHLRKALYFPAISARRFNPLIQEFCTRLEENGLAPMEVIVAAMRKLLHIAFGVLKNDCPFDPNYEQSLRDPQFIPVFQLDF